MTVENKSIHVLSRAVIVDQGHILVCKTMDLSPGFFFLPGGHIEHGESAEEAVLRELQEEANATCSISRLLGCLEYNFPPGHSSICHNHEYNFIFEAHSDDLKLEKSIDRMEKHIKLMWVPLHSIDTIDFRPEPLKKILLSWIQSDRISFHSKMLSNKK